MFYAMTVVDSAVRVRSKLSKSPNKVLKYTEVSCCTCSHKPSKSCQQLRNTIVERIQETPAVLSSLIGSKHLIP